MDAKEKRVYKIVLTGGPCGGKTTGQARLSTFFENLGWKVFRVPETATVLLSGGIKFSDLTEEQAYKFQENLLKTMLQIENTFFELADSCSRNCLIICDRGAMDASAFISKEQWEKMMFSNGWNNVELRDNRYNQIIHMVTAANGAEDFYTTEFQYFKMYTRVSSQQFVDVHPKLADDICKWERDDLIINWRRDNVMDCDSYILDHACRSEGMELARELDYKAAAAWVGHPYFDVVDNSTEFEKKIRRMIASICQKMGIDTGDRLLTNARKRKFLVKAPLPDDSIFPPFQDFEVVHNYLTNANPYMQARLRKRGQKGHWSYTHTIRKPRLHGQIVEVKTQLTHRDYINLLSQKDDSHFTIYKKRRCFLDNNQYFQLDIYKDPCHPRCTDLILLETYSALEDGRLEECLPKFLKLVCEVTGDPAYSMYNLSLREEWSSSSKFCHALKVPEMAETTTNGIGTSKNGSYLGSKISNHNHISNKHTINGN